MKEFVIAHILDDVETGDRFTLWPLHVTILPPFQADNKEQVVDAVEQTIKSSAPINVQLGEFAQFGAKRIVRKLIINPELQSLHDKLLQLANLQGWDVPQKYVGRYYTPHITRKAERDYIGENFTMSELCIVEALPQGYRQIVKKLPFMVGI
ncbi:MAG: 2'-5' RNA ligase family protein [bacterium]|nr:2'-5' RNA ligase family protein [bacterium]